MISFLKKTVCVTGVGLVLMSCNTVFVDGEDRNLSVRYEKSRLKAETGALFNIGDDYRTSFASAVRQLRNAGYSILSSDAQTGQISVATNDNDAVDCGTLATGENGDLRIFPANAAQAVLEVRADGGGSTFVLRKVVVNSTATIAIGVDPAQSGQTLASISEQHHVQLTIVQASDNTVIYDQTVQFSGRDTATFRRGVECGSAKLIRQTISRN